MEQQQKATGRLYNTLHQVVHHIPRWSIERLARRHGVDARKLSATSHVVLLMLGHLSQARCLMEILDDAMLHKSKLYLARRSRPTARNTFSHANRTRPCEVAEELYWETARHLCAVSPGFVPPKRVSGFLSRFNERGIFAIDSTTFLLALNCLESFPYRKRKAAAKAHMRLRVGSFIPSVVRIESGRPQDCTMADELTKDMQAGDILLADRGYTDFGFLHNLSARKVFWVLRQKADMFYEIMGRREVKGEVLADEEVRLKAWTTHLKYPEVFRRVHARVEVDGKKVEMTFLTNNMKWEARTICELYKARWAIEVFFKELKQTLQFSDFIGTNTNAVKWQIWTGLLVHLLLHYLKYLSSWKKPFSRLVGLVKCARWVDCNIVESLKLYGTAGPPARPQPCYRQQYLAGFGHDGVELMG